MDMPELGNYSRYAEDNPDSEPGVGKDQNVTKTDRRTGLEILVIESTHENDPLGREIQGMVLFVGMKTMQPYYCDRNIFARGGWKKEQ